MAEGFLKPAREEEVREQAVYVNEELTIHSPHSPRPPTLLHDGSVALNHPVQAEITAKSRIGDLVILHASQGHFDAVYGRATVPKERHSCFACPMQLSATRFPNQAGRPGDLQGACFEMLWLIRLRVISSSCVNKDTGPVDIVGRTH